MPRFARITVLTLGITLVMAFPAMATQALDVAAVKRGPELSLFGWLYETAVELYAKIGMEGSPNGGIVEGETDSSSDGVARRDSEEPHYQSET